jgi:type IV pilus assembly protein PilA
MQPRSRSGDDEAFTLIELLVVIVIVGVLAAIAIPVFMRQREKAWDVAVEADLRNAAMAQDAFLTEGTDPGDWATDVGQLQALGFRPSGDNSYFGGTFALAITITGADYCMTARSQSGAFLGFGSSTGAVHKDGPIDHATCS